MAKLSALFVLVVSVGLALACQPPDCDHPDCGSCSKYSTVEPHPSLLVIRSLLGNACCTINFKYGKLNNIFREFDGFTSNVLSFGILFSCRNDC